MRKRINADQARARIRKTPARQTRVKNRARILVALAALLGLSSLLFVNTSFPEEGFYSVTTFMGLPLKPSSPTIKIILPQTETATGALFDVILTIPEKSMQLEGDEALVTAIELVNFGQPGTTSVSFVYIVTNNRGDVVLIEHERKLVETQAAFFKTIELPELPPGTYKLLVEMLYSNSSAVAVGEFHVSR